MCLKALYTYYVIASSANAGVAERIHLTPSNHYQSLSLWAQYIARGFGRRAISGYIWWGMVVFVHIHGVRETLSLNPEGEFRMRESQTDVLIRIFRLTI
jgi:hypothetical protein